MQLRSKKKRFIVSFEINIMIHSFFGSISNRITNVAKRDTMPLIDLQDDNQNDVDTTTIPNVQIEQPSSTNGHCSHDTATHLRAKLRYFSMSPCWKWHLKRQKPWKAWFQFIKIIIVTAQVDFYIKENKILQNESLSSSFFL